MSRWIDADALTKRVEDSNKSAGLHIEDLRKIRKWIKKAPSIDIVRCKECKHAHMTYGGDCKHCDMWKDDDDFCLELYLDGDFYCSYGERRE